MTQNKKKGVNYIGIDVLTEAKKRINHVIDCFDELVCAFSGGKDSLVIIYLVREVYDERGINKPVKVIFRDEELIPDDVIKFVLEVKADTERFDLTYFAVPMLSEKYVLGKKYEYIQWDNKREWLRPKPEGAITTSGSTKPMSQYDMDKFCIQGLKGKVAMVNGIRSDESLVRFRACMNKRNENYINATESPNVKLVKPIFDWSENDVFRYFYDRKIRYCSIYDVQKWNGQALRVSTPLHAEAAKELHKLKTAYPTFYQQLMDIFPEMIVHERYFKDLDRFAIINRYPKSWRGIHLYIKENISDPKKRAIAFSRVEMARKIRSNNERTGKAGRPENMWGYPIMYVFQQVVNGSYKRVIQPCKTPTKAQVSYEDFNQAV